MLSVQSLQPKLMRVLACIYLHFTYIFIQFNPDMVGMQKVLKLKPSKQDSLQVLFWEDYTSLHLECLALHFGK